MRGHRQHHGPVTQPPAANRHVTAIVIHVGALSCVAVHTLAGGGSVQSFLRPLLV